VDYKEDVEERPEKNGKIFEPKYMINTKHP